MAVASTPTLLSLDRFAQIAGLHPLHFNQVYVANVAELSAHCESTILQHSWQMNAGVSREEIAQAIAQSEDEIEEFLKFSLAPKYYDDIVQPVQSYRAGYLYSADSTLLVNLNRGYVLSGGIRATTALALASPIVYTDSDSDGYTETATVTVLNVTCSADEVKVFYPGKTDQGWEIRPIRVSITGTTATISFKREQCVLEAAIESYSAQPVEGTDNANFLTTCDVYRVYTDLSAQATHIARSYPCMSSCSDSSCARCSWTETTGCISVVHSRLSQVHTQIGTWDSDSQSYLCACPALCTLPPTKIRVRYIAGLNLEGSTGQKKIPTKYELAIARLAMTKLDRAICSCDSIQGNFSYWTQDLASTISEGGSTEVRQIAQSILECPFGTTRAGIMTYNLLREQRLYITGATHVQ